MLSRDSATKNLPTFHHNYILSLLFQLYLLLSPTRHLNNNMGLLRSLLVLVPASFLSTVDAFSPSSPALLTPSARLSTSLYAAAEIQFVKGLEEKVIPDIKLTRARDGSSGIATFKFKNPNVFDASTASAGDVTGMFLVDSEGELSTTSVNASFINGKPQAIESTLVMTSPEEWDRFMRFMERYGEANGLGFTKSS